MKCVGGSSKVTCPALTTSPPGASECSCIAGFYDVEGACAEFYGVEGGFYGVEGGCAECHPGQYCIGNGIEQANTLSTPAATVISDCKCPPGKFGKGGYDCNPCTPGSFCPGGGVKSECQGYL
ncbi:hypothetical protein T484DRAFT_1765959 [Baffinella frigidus]|nr:hypothetical protein T484DRAFT_1765959 [Cryptophyta sp. CCMP2293]